MLSCIEYQHKIRQQFKDLPLPDEGITLGWMVGVKSLQILIDEASYHYGTKITVLVTDLAYGLQGTALFAWNMRASLTSICDTIKLIEAQMCAYSVLVQATKPAPLPLTSFPSVN